MSTSLKKIENISKHLQERIKELTCLYDISKIAQRQSLSLDEIILQIIKVIPGGWQYPKKLHVLIRIDEQEFGNRNISSNKQRATIKINEENRGEIVVFYNADSEKKTFSKPLFLAEEKQLINQIAIELAVIIARYDQRELEKFIELKLRYNDRLNVLGELTAGIAHELNTPLANILGYAEILKKSEENGSKKTDLQRIITSAINAREIVKKLMYFSCEMPSQFSTENLNNTIIDSLQLLQIQLNENQITLDLNLSKKPNLLRLDPIQFSQVIFNLVLNAIAAMPLGGTLKITTINKQDKVVLKIQDQGVGIGKAEIIKIFQPFYSTKPSGTGLGLAVVHGIIQSHKGTITVISDKGKGTEFTITLPLNN